MQQYPPDNNQAYPQSGAQWQQPQGYSQQPPTYYSPMQPPPPGYYPPMQPPPPPKKKHTGLIIGLVSLAVVIVVCAVIGAAVTSASRSAVTAVSTVVTQQQTAVQSTVQSSSTQSTQSAPTGSTVHHKVGETITVNNQWSVIVSKASTDPGDGQFNIPKAGNVYLLIDVVEKNVSDKVQHASGLIDYTLRGTDGTKYDESIVYGKDPGGAVNTGDQIKGTLAYEVPTGIKTFRLAFSPNLTGDPETWDISV